MTYDAAINRRAGFWLRADARNRLRDAGAVWQHGVVTWSIPPIGVVTTTPPPSQLSLELELDQ
jgi:hypothetical protein